MRAIFKTFLAAMLLAQGAFAQDLTALARVDPARSQVEDQWLGKTTLTIGLSQGVPFRVFTLDGPARLVVDFREADWAGVAPQMILAEPGRIRAYALVRFSLDGPGWWRI